MYHFTCTEQETPDTSEVHRLLQNCESSEWNLLDSCHPPGAGNSEVALNLYRQFVDLWSYLSHFARHMTHCAGFVLVPVDDQCPCVPACVTSMLFFLAPIDFRLLSSQN